MEYDSRFGFYCVTVNIYYSLDNMGKTCDVKLWYLEFQETLKDYFNFKGAGLLEFNKHCGYLSELILTFRCRRNPCTSVRLSVHLSIYNLKLSFQAEKDTVD